MTTKSSSECSGSKVCGDFRFFDFVMSTKSSSEEPAFHKTHLDIDIHVKIITQTILSINYIAL